jgi:hypothetical protein
VGKWHFYSGKGIKCQDLSQKKGKEVKRMNEINDKKRIEWIAEDLFAGSELVCISLRFNIPPELWEKFKKSELYKELTGENIYLEDWNGNFNVETGEKLNPTCAYCWVLKKEDFDCGYDKCPGRNLHQILNGNKQAIEDFLKIERTAIKDSKVEERKAYTCIDPDSYTGKEIRYQTTVLKNIEHQNVEIIRLLKKRANKITRKY